jgi:hypothetical protein
MIGSIPWVLCYGEGHARVSVRDVPRIMGGQSRIHELLSTYASFNVMIAFFGILYSKPSHSRFVSRQLSHARASLGGSFRHLTISMAQ